MEKIERSYTRLKPILREAENGAESRKIEGYAIVFGKPSVDMGWDGEITEYIDRESVKPENLKADIKMTLWHNRERLLARTMNGEGTLKLSLDNKGLKFEFEAPHTPDGDTALELVKRGDLAGCSFIAYVTKRTVQKEGEHVNVHIQEMNVCELTIGSDPAYPDTKVAAREETGDKTGKADAEARHRRIELMRLKNR